MGCTSSSHRCHRAPCAVSFVGFRGCCKPQMSLLNYWTTKNAYSAYGFCTNADPGLTMWSVVKLGMHALMPTGYGFALYASVYIMYWKRKSRHKGSVRNHSSVICFMLHRVMQSCALILFLSCPSCPWQSCLTSIHTFVLNLLILIR